MNPNCFETAYHGDEVWSAPQDSYGQYLPTNSILYTPKEARTIPLSPWKRATILNHALQPLCNPARNITIDPRPKRVSNNVRS